MNEIEKIRNQQKATSNYLDSLTTLTHEILKLQGLLDFCYVSINYAEANIPQKIVDEWYQTTPIFPEFSRRLDEFYQSSPQNAVFKTNGVEITTVSAIADTYSFILNNISHIDGAREKEGFNSISATYNHIINGEDARQATHSFVYKINPLAASKFLEGSRKLMNPAENEDDSNSFNNLRSALNTTIRTLIDQIGDVKPPTQTEIIPRIAKYYGRDQSAQVDLVIRNRNFLLLWIKLSKVKDMTLGGDQAMGLALEIISILFLLSSTTKLPNQN